MPQFIPIDFKRILATGLLILSVLIHLPQTVADEPEKVVAEFEQTFSTVLKTLKELERHLMLAATQKSKRQRERRNWPQRLHVLKQQVIQVDNLIQADFAEMEQQLRTRGLLKTLGKRHQQTRERYQKHVTTLLGNLQELEASFDDHQALEHQTQQALNHLRQVQIPHQPAYEPSNLPFRVPKASSLEPFTTPEEYQREIKAEEANQTSAQTRKRRSRKPTSADLAETETVQITAEIRALAEELEYQPVKIYNWAVNNIAFIPSYGATQGSQLTLTLRQGNGFDVASLVCALMRASQIHCRIAYGTLEISPERLISWFQVPSIQAGLNLLSQAAIPHKALVAEGTVKAVQLEHAWALAYVDFYPSRGSRHRKGDTWIPLDASFKQHEFKQGLNLLEKLPFDLEGLREHLIETTFVNEAGGVLGISQEYFKNLVNDYRIQLQDYIEAHEIKPQDVVDQYIIIPSLRLRLAAGLPYQHIATLDRFTEIPTHLRNSLTIQFYQTEVDQMLGNSILDYTISLPALKGQRLGVFYEPATEADAQALEELAASGSDSIPLYLFEVKPVLKLDDTVLASGPFVGMGETQYYSFTIHHPHTSYSHKGTATAGDAIVFGVNGNGINPLLIQQRLAQVPSNTAAENLHQVGLHFWRAHSHFQGQAGVLNLSKNDP